MGDGCVFHFRAWSTTLTCLIVGGGIICGWDYMCGGGELFPLVCKMGKSKQNDIVETWKFRLKMGDGGQGWWVNSFFALSVILRTLV